MRNFLVILPKSDVMKMMGWEDYFFFGRFSVALSSKVDSETYTVMFEWSETSCSVPKMYVTLSDLIVILIDYIHV